MTHTVSPIAQHSTSLAAEGALQADVASLSQDVPREVAAMCDLTAHPVHQCAQALHAMHEPHWLWDCATIGMTFMVAALTGGIAVLFVKCAGASWRAARAARVTISNSRQHRREIKHELELRRHG